MTTDRTSCCDPIEFLLHLLFTFTYRVRNLVFQVYDATLSSFIGRNFKNVFFVNDNVYELLPKQFECTLLYHILLEMKVNAYAKPLIELPDFR